MQTPSPPLFPGPETGLRWRSIGADDVDAWYALIRRMAEADKPGWVEDRRDLEQALETTSGNPAQDTLIGLDKTGAARAYGRIALNPGSETGSGFGGVDPQWRRRGIGAKVYRWQETRLRQRLFTEHRKHGVLRTYAEEANASQVALLESEGAQVVRYFTEMSRPLAGDLPDAGLPEGMEFRTFNAEISDAVRRAHNEAFKDHWGSEPRNKERWGFTVDHPQFRPEWSFAVVDTGTGEVAAYQLASFDPESKDIHGYKEGYTMLLGVRRGWRGRKLAPAMLGEAMRRFRDGGMDNAGLGVDTENPSGALGLYESLGYRPTHREVVFDKTVL
ncbi:GNAT family N-acetyltransferase [Arthrobacter sp. zg-Y769]|uniref:GNAT family N-acetyltransferase n=1 Tax=Arthrobacter sp. zg-Y769 TaxID=2894191 RepID=UPI001E63307A|nr:GNAT family N-acetyltransferase [Arthrobacter sp. zg-Y769]MCC9205126.1 GNAT family N-acetyltransferase [Arthrobacter sp. zg-Y769]